MMAGRLRCSTTAGFLRRTYSAALRDFAATRSFGRVTSCVYTAKAFACAAALPAFLPPLHAYATAYSFT